MPEKSSKTLKVFIGCPGDMAPERAALLSLRDHLDELGCPVRFLIWKNATPGAGDAQKIIFDNYPIETWDIFIGLLWTRFGVPSGIVDPVSRETLTGTEAEFAGAYDAFLASGGRRPQILLYHCARDLPSNVDIGQLIGVRKFFQQTETGARRPALTQDFKTVEDLKQRVTQDLVKVAERLRKAAKRQAISGGKPARVERKEPDWKAAVESYRRHLCDTHYIVKFHIAAARQPVEIELEKVFIKLRTQPQAIWLDSVVDRLFPPSGTEQGEAGRKFGEDEQLDFVRGYLHKRVSPQEARVRKREVAANLAKQFPPEVFGPRSQTSSLPPISLSEILFRYPHLVLVGSPGSGKSTLLQYLVLTFAAGQQQARLQLDEERLPALIRLRQFHRWVEGLRHEKKLDQLKPAHFHEFLAYQWAEEKGAPELPDGFFSRLFRDNRALILLDGLDEVADPTQRRAVAACVAAALDEWGRARVILTSRPKAWESEGRAVLTSGVGEARVCDLDDAQIEEFVRQWYLAATFAARGDTAAARGHAESRAIDLISAVKPERIRRLAATPLMLSILAMVHSRGVGLPQDRSQLYHECIEFMLGYWDEIAGFFPDPELHEVAARDRQTKRQLIQPVALWMHRLGSEQIEPFHDDLMKQFADGFQSVLNEPRPAAERHARFFLRLIVERGGLMQESEAGQFRFVHLTFQEYLAASAIAHGEVPFAQIEKHLHDPWWREVILLAGGELSRQKSYRTKEDTYAWLAGIRDAGTWAEPYLLRDLQLACQSCVEMRETGVNPQITEELARRVVAALMEREEGAVRVDLRETVRQSPVGHFTQAIAAELAGMRSVVDDRGFRFVLEVVQQLPPGSATSSLLATLSNILAAETSMLERGASGAAWVAAHLLVLHAAPPDRLAALKQLQALRGPLGGNVRPDFAERLFALGDERLSEAMCAWARLALASDVAIVAAESAELLVRYGSEQDRMVGLKALVCQLSDNPQGMLSFNAGLAVQRLGAFADTPQILSQIEANVAKTEPGSFNSFRWAWRTIQTERAAKVDCAEMCRHALDPKFQMRDHAAALALQHGDAKIREAVRGDIAARINGAESDKAIELLSLLLINDPEADKRVLVARAEPYAPALAASSNAVFADFAARLGATAWEFPDFLKPLITWAMRVEAEALNALVALISLVRVRPPGSTSQYPTVVELARHTLQLVAEPEVASSAREIVRALTALSTFPELRKREICAAP
jgi:hypothetical protein